VNKAFVGVSTVVADTRRSQTRIAGLRRVLLRAAYDIAMWRTTRYYHEGMNGNGISKTDLYGATLYDFPKIGTQRSTSKVISFELMTMWRSMK
jgi:hypothetical protein